MHLRPYTGESRPPAEVIDLAERQAKITQLATEARKGNEKAFGQLVKMFRGEMLATARRNYTRDNQADAEDLVQDTLTSVWKNIQHIDDPEKFRAYLYTSLKRKAMDRAKKKKELLARTDEEHAFHLGQADTATPFDALLEDQQLLQQALDSLDPSYRQLFTLRYVDGLSHEELQQRLSTTRKKYR